VYHVWVDFREAEVEWGTLETTRSERGLVVRGSGSAEIPASGTLEGTFRLALRLRFTNEDRDVLAPEWEVAMRLEPALDADEEREARIRELVSRLGAEDWREREDAQRALVKMGQAALPQLREAARSADPEVATRASAAVAEIEAGAAIIGGARIRIDCGCSVALAETERASRIVGMLRVEGFSDPLIVRSVRSGNGYRMQTLVGRWAIDSTDLAVAPRVSCVVLVRKEGRSELTLEKLEGYRIPPVAPQVEILSEESR
jgi:hypothetical protein